MKYRSLLLRSNRFLGSALVNNNLVQVEELEAANEKLLEVIQTKNLKQASLLNILVYDLKILKEASLIDYLQDNYGIGLIDLNHYDLEKSVAKDIDLELCWATWTVPFDTVENFHFLASAYYISAPVLKFWDEQIEGNIVWYSAPISSISNTLTTLESSHEEEPQAQESR